MKVYSQLRSCDHVINFKKDCVTTYRERIKFLATSPGNQDAVLVLLTQYRVERVLLENRGVHVRGEHERVHITVITFFSPEATGQLPLRKRPNAKSQRKRTGVVSSRNVSEGTLTRESALGTGHQRNLLAQIIP